MMRWIVGSSLKFRFIVVALTAFLMFFGVQQLGNTAVDVFPEFAPPKVEVHTVAIGLAPTEVEELITVPLEQSFNGIPGRGDNPFQVGRAAVADRAAVRAGNRSAGGPPAGGGANRDGYPDAAQLGGPTRHASAAVGDQPGAEDRAIHDRSDSST